MPSSSAAQPVPVSHLLLSYIRAEEYPHVARCSKITYAAVSELLQVFAEATQETETWSGNTWECSYTNEGLGIVFEEDEHGRPLRVRMQSGTAC